MFNFWTYANWWRILRKQQDFMTISGSFRIWISLMTSRSIKSSSIKPSILPTCKFYKTIFLSTSKDLGLFLILQNLSLPSRRYSNKNTQKGNCLDGTIKMTILINQKLSIVLLARRYFWQTRPLSVIWWAKNI